MAHVEPLTQDEVAALNPGVRKLVPFLREWGFQTMNSGDGETHECSCDLEYPFVLIEVPAGRMVAEADRLYFFLRHTVGLSMGDKSKAEETADPDVDVHYNAATGEAQIMLVNVTDLILPDHLPKPWPRWTSWLKRIWG